MQFRDLADQEVGVFSQETAVVSTTGSATWVVLQSGLLQEELLVLVFDKKDLRDARREHPEKAIYFPPEIEELYQHKDDKKFIRTMHKLKKRFRGWVVPSKPDSGEEHV